MISFKPAFLCVKILNIQGASAAGGISSLLYLCHFSCKSPKCDYRFISLERGYEKTYIYIRSFNVVHIT
jgi:hypothetical protein